MLLLFSMLLKCVGRRLEKRAAHAQLPFSYWLRLIREGHPGDVQLLLAAAEQTGNSLKVTGAGCLGVAVLILCRFLLFSSYA